MLVATQSRKERAGAVAFRRVGHLAILILAFLLALISYLDYANFEKTYLDLIASRSRVMAEDLAQAVEYGLNLGLRLDQMTQLGKLVVETQAADPDILWVAVADSQDKPLFTAPPEATHSASVRVEALTKSHPELAPGESYFTRVRLTNSFGRDSGSVVIAWSRTAVNTKLARVAKEMWQQTLAVLGLFAALILLVSFVLARGFDRYEARLHRLLAQPALALDNQDTLESAVASIAGETDRLSQALDARLERPKPVPTGRLPSED